MRRRIIFIAAFLFIIFLFISALIEYEGDIFVYVLFSIISNYFFYCGFTKNAIFFDTFIGILFWIAFWLKLTVKVAFVDGQFIESVGSFDYSGASFDKALIISSIGLLGLMLARYIRAKYILSYPEKQDKNNGFYLFLFYKNHRNQILFAFVLFFTSIAALNLYFGIYQRGIIPKTDLPYFLNGVIKWLLLFGLASISALILHSELKISKGIKSHVVLLVLMENFFSNVSLLSRGMIINSGALALGVYKHLHLNNIKLNTKYIYIIFFTFIIIFICSIYLVNNLRISAYYQQFPDHNPSRISYEHKFSTFHSKIEIGTRLIIELFIDRWVGIEGVMAVSSLDNLGWDLFDQAWAEEFQYGKHTFYDDLIDSRFRLTDSTRYHYISLPGIIGFAFYPGSYLFLFVFMLVAGLLAGFIEMSAYRLCGKNVILCSLIAMVVTYRYMHFGYVPFQSYLLFGALFLNLLIIFFADKLLSYWYRRKLNL